MANIPCGKKLGFNRYDQECVFCPENILCIQNSQHTVLCSLKDGKKCTPESAWRNSCNFDHCDRILGLMRHKKKFPCKSFGSPQMHDKITDCLNCPEDTFEQCEIMEVLLKNQENFNLEEAAESITQLKLEISSEENSCFGEYANRSVCFDECEFVHRCIRETGITGNSLCKFFPRNALQLRSSDRCQYCICFEECENLLIDEDAEMKKKIAEEKNMKKSFFHNTRDLRSIYNEFTNEEN